MIGIIGGTGVYHLVERGDLKEKKVLNTPFGESPPVSIFILEIRRLLSYHDIRRDMTFHLT